MFLREIASSQHNAREKGKHAAVRAMLRDTRLNSISVIAGEKIQQCEFGNKFKQNVLWSVSLSFQITDCMNCMLIEKLY